jgi:hypothetical protein
MRQTQLRAEGLISPADGAFRLFLIPQEIAILASLACERQQHICTLGLCMGPNSI